MDRHLEESRFRPLGGSRRMLAVTLRLSSRRRPCFWEQIRVFGPSAVWARPHPAHQLDWLCESGPPAALVRPVPATLDRICAFVSPETWARPSRGHWT